MEKRKELEGLKAGEVMRIEFAKAVSLGKSTELTEYDQVSKELYTVLFDKTKGTAHRKVENVSIGEGILAYWRLHWWFTEVSKVEMSSQRTQLAQPPMCKKDELLAAAVENWERQL